MSYSLEIDDELNWAMALLLELLPSTFANKQKHKGNKKTTHITTLKRHLELKINNQAPKWGGSDAFRIPNKRTMAINIIETTNNQTLKGRGGGGGEPMNVLFT
jgi:hypothetical protein